MYARDAIEDDDERNEKTCQINPLKIIVIRYDIIKVDDEIEENYVESCEYIQEGLCSEPK